MLDALIRFSLANRLVVLALATVLLVWGSFTALRMPVDVFPDLTAPTVTVLAEAHGLAPEEVESLVTFPIETAMNGAPGVRRVRSSTAAGVAVVWVEFAWGADVYRARQLVSEKLQLAASALPPDLPPPVLAPISSIMGEIMFIALHGEGKATPMDVRGAADWIVRRRLLTVSGVAQVIPIGGEVKQYQVQVDPAKLRARSLSLDGVVVALRASNRNVSGGFLSEGGQEYLVRGLGRVSGPDDIASIVLASGASGPIRVGDVADVILGAATKRGEGSYNASPAVVMAILKQPDANTLDLTGRVDATLDEIAPALPPGVTIARQNFRQADFIGRAVSNVAHALRDGALLVAVIIFAFLLNARATLASLIAIPLSLLAALLALDALGGTINTMTLGGLTIAIGALVDDAIIDVENVHRRLRENAALPADEQRPALAVVFAASREVRGAIFFATLIIMLVFIPFFFLSGVEGRMLKPLGFAYLVAIAASLVVALTITPVVCYYLLGRRGARHEGESPVVVALKRVYRPILDAALAHPAVVMTGSATLLVAALTMVPFLGRAFLPEFNEGALTVAAVTLPGTSLATSDELGRRLERILLGFPEVTSTSRRTGRAELDEHAQGVNASEIDVVFTPSDRSKEALLAEVRKAVSVLPMNVTLGGPLAHRIDHMLSGTRAGLAVKIFGEDRGQLRRLGKQIEAAMKDVPGVVDLAVDQQVEIPQLAIHYDHAALARYGLTTGAVGEAIDTGLQGEAISKVLDGQRTFDLVVRYHEAARANRVAIATLPIAIPGGGMIPLSAIATISTARGPNTISRENVQRKLVVGANVAGRDLASVVADVRRAIGTKVKFPTGYYVVYGGQIESADASIQTLGTVTGAVLAGIAVLLVVALRSWRAAFIVLANLPLALIGGVFAVWLSGGVLSVASLVGFITLFGIATRNGLMLISHYHHLLEVEGASFREAIVRGSHERLVPVLMTALTAGLGLVPLVVRGAEPGNEIQAPMAVVILGGLLGSTFLNMIVIPALFAKYGRPRESAKEGTCTPPRSA